MTVGGKAPKTGFKKATAWPGETVFFLVGWFKSKIALSQGTCY